MPLNLSNYKRISGLTEKTELETSDAFAVDNSTDAASQKITYQSLRAQLKTFFALGSLSSGHYVQGISYAADLKLLDVQLYDQADIAGDILADLAPVQASATASRAYAAGSYLVYNGQLYLVTEEIASGGTITVGTNVAAVTVGSALINAALSLADAYDAGMLYSEGDVVTRSSGLYICTTATSGTWDSSCWSTVTVGDLVASLEDEIGTINTALDGKQDELTFDTIPTSGSANPVTSGGVHTAIQTETTARAQMDTNIKAGTQAQKAYHLGLYIDSDGDICQA